MSTFARNRTTWLLPAGTMPAGARVLVDRTCWAAPTSTDVLDSRTRHSATGHEVVGLFDARVPAHQDTEAVAPRGFRLLGIRPSIGGAA
ncbi:hypothetical protein CLV43_101268 [Umezawaea tangerina]|uniref:Uncharacterized protein n=2 Tax=Umezawaea tangerina TaxID=84725 RepID=A0A2T0TJW1_9PSEU|nr:hypothetical protein CLV43_101268 [Umezawaea tangerina]